MNRGVPGRQITDDDGDVAGPSPMALPIAAQEAETGVITRGMIIMTLVIDGINAWGVIATAPQTLQSGILRVVRGVTAGGITNTIAITRTENSITVGDN